MAGTLGIETAMVDTEVVGEVWVALPTVVLLRHDLISRHRRVVMVGDQTNTREQDMAVTRHPTMAGIKVGIKAETKAMEVTIPVMAVEAGVEEAAAAAGVTAVTAVMVAVMVALVEAPVAVDQRDTADMEAKHMVDLVDIMVAAADMAGMADQGAVVVVVVVAADMEVMANIRALTMHHLVVGAGEVMTVIKLNMQPS
jgi:hypothetical protein